MCKITGGDKVGARAMSVNKSTGFCCMSVTPSSLRLGTLLWNDLQVGAFF